MSTTATATAFAAPAVPAAPGGPAVRPGPAAPARAATSGVRPAPAAPDRAATSAAQAAPAAPAARPGYDPDAATTERRVLPMLADERVVWLSTVHPDGAPHLVPTWYWWDGEALLFWSKPDAVKVRNLRANPRLMVAVGDAAADFSVGLIEAVAELVDAAVPDAFFAKYGAELDDGRLDRAGFEALYTQAVRVVPTRFLSWHGRGERHQPASRAGAVGREGPVLPARRRPRLAAGLAERLAHLLGRGSERLRHPAYAPLPSAGT